MQTRSVVAALLFFSALAGAEDPAIELLVRADDMGVSQAFNEGCVLAARAGIVRSVEVIVPGAWFLDAVKRLQELPELDVGVHLCLTSEWERCKWRPLTQAPSLVDADGYFFPMTSQRQNFPPGTGFLDARPKLDEVERELRAQIVLARKHLPRVSHVTAHMGAALATPEIAAVTRRLAREFGLLVESEGLQSVQGFRGDTAAAREGSLLELIAALKPGRWLLVEHPSIDSPESRALGHVGYYHVAAERAAVLSAFTSASVQAALRQRGVRLVSYRDLAKAPLSPGR